MQGVQKIQRYFRCWIFLFLFIQLDSYGFEFYHHFVDENLPGSRWGQTALVDIDRDGDLDFVTGKSGGDVLWYGFESHDKSWTRHLLGENSPSDVGGVILDVDRDGRLDFVAGGAWYRQPENLNDQPWERHLFDPDLRSVHDIIAADLDGDGLSEVITMSDKNDLRSYQIPKNNPFGSWTSHHIHEAVHSGISAGDLDRDGDIDLVRSQIWLENLGNGIHWKTHAFCGVPWADRKEKPFFFRASKSWIADLNRDGRKDILLTENEIPGGRIAWFEAPLDPRNTPWKIHYLPMSHREEEGGPFHSLQLRDFDLDGDLDVFAGEMEGLGDAPRRWYIWDNVKGDASSFEQHVILDANLGTHETQAGDVDGDGDIDLVGKLWRADPFNGNQGRNHVDFLENLLITEKGTRPQPPQTKSDFFYIDTSFENASPLWWEVDDLGRVQVYLNYDQERESPNRANGHWHFKVQAAAGSQHTLVLNHLNNVWNGKPGVPVSSRTICKVSHDGQQWRTIPTEIIHGDQLQIQIEMPDESHELFIAHVEPYRISDLERLKDQIADHPLIHIENIGKTVQGRELEIIRVGKISAPYRIFIRARAHPWEPGGNWVVQGLIQSLLEPTSDNESFLDTYSIYIMPMANKDGVAAGKTRFNMMGMDLNRKWDKPADIRLAPENYHLEQWFQKMNTQNQNIHLAMDLHNDQSGRIHISRPNIDLEAYLERMKRYETLMRRHTWFTEGSTGGSFRNPGTIGEGLLERFGITAFVQELNANWIEGLQDHTSANHWELLGSQMRRVFYEFFQQEQRETASAQQHP